LRARFDYWPAGLEIEMPPAPLPHNEAERLADLRSFDILDTEADAALEEVVRLAARLSGCPIAMVSLVDRDRQWFLARVGLEARETPRSDALCAHAILDPSHPLAVADASRDPRFVDSALVAGPPHVRAYLGVPLVSAGGHPLGVLCVVDQAPRRHDAETVRALEVLARTVTSNLELRRALRRTQEIALTDALTGLPNRRALQVRLAQELAGDGMLAAVILDLDHVKQVNEAQGHAAGDALLRAAAERLRAAVRPGDMVARTGGDEFAVILTGLGDEAQARDAAARIAATLRPPVAFDDCMLPAGATLGVALSSPGSRDGDMLLRAADAALVRAKRDERGSIGWSGPDDAAQLLRRAAVLRAFDAAGNGQCLAGVAAYLQPIVALGAQAGAPPVMAMEALARWFHPELGEVPPSELLSIIGPERTVRLGAAVRRRALAAMAALRQRELPVGRLALNLSAGEVEREDIAASLAAQVARAGLSLRDVEIEITEEVLLERVSDATLQQLAALRGRGARLVLDDFGTGNSGLSQLLRLPLDAVKLDKRFVQGLGLDSRAEEIVRATISLAHGLGLEVVGEGVETMQQARMLMRMGCDAAQGYLYARPMPPEAVPDWLAPEAGAEVIPLWAARPAE
jgi:diguanylate cyclase (GGDEF)-like protein